MPIGVGSYIIQDRGSPFDWLCALAKMHFQSYRKILFYSIEAEVVRQAVLEFFAVGVKTLKHCLGFMSRLADGIENL